MAFAYTVFIMSIAAPAAGRITVIHQKPTFMIHFLNMAAAGAGEALPDVCGTFSEYDRENSDVSAQLHISGV
ncbi:MAG: hypothetical protein IJ418_11365 [Clostridia bacterium]|nr:hypothetical protein [Clostridia bacterium]